ncbi:MAG TPA: alpha/beta fold hydrolase [Streptosporangiaceae bacterium]|nr:alpha/beta fold hydrolase [Streptosporangiaceae bacterium]
MTDQAAKQYSVRVPGGRSAEVLVAGQADDGLPLVFHTGTPAGLADYPPLREAAARAGLRCVMYARPGYGKSDPQPGRRVADAAGDVAAILDHLGAATFVTAGWSGGGPHALACAALLPGRCLAAATLAGVAPYDAEGLDWLGGMAGENVIEFSAAVSGEAALANVLAPAAAELASATADSIAEALGTLVTAADLATLTGEFGEYSALSSRAAMESGIEGWVEDDLAFVRDWGFEVSDVAAPVAIWQGGQDAMVPFAHGHWLAAHVPGAVRHLLADEGHLSLVANHAKEIFADLAALASRPV